MGNKKENNSKQQTSLTRQQMEQKEALEAKRTRTFITVFAIVALVAVVASIILAFGVEFKRRGNSIDYFNDDLSKYVYISEEDYKSFDVVVDVEKVSDLDVEIALVKALCANKNKTPLYDGKYLKNQTVSIGDVVYIWYMGYTLDENGEKVTFEGGCNFNAASASLEIGSGSFINGFEYNLIGKNPRDYSTFTKVESGTVPEGATVQVTLTGIFPNGTTTTNTSVMVDLSSPLCDEKYGEGFAAALVGKTIGEKLEDNFTTTNPAGMTGTAAYTNVTVQYVYDVGDNPLTIEAYFPADYSEKSLAGKDVLFDVYIDKAQLYEAPEFNDAFVTETLKLTESDLSDYEGETLAQKYKASLRAALEEEYESEVQLAIETAMWEHYLAKVQVKKLPEYEVDYYHTRYINDFVSQYETYGSSYGSLDAFASTELGLSSGESWTDVLLRQAKDAVTEKLVFYYVIVREGFVPKGEEFDRLYEETVNTYLESYLAQAGCKRENYDNEQLYLNAREAYKQTMMSYYNEEYFTEETIFTYAIERISAFANVTYKD